MQKVKRILQILLFFGIALVLLYFAFKGVDKKVLVEGFSQANYFWVGASLLIGFSSHIIRALRWKLLIEPLGFNPSLINTLGALSIGYSANLLFPRMGEVVRCTSLRKSDGAPFESLFGTVIVERAFDLLMMFILVVIVFVVRIDFFGKFIYDEAIIPIAKKMSALLTNPWVYIILLVGLMGVVLAFLKVKGKFRAKFRSLLKGLVDGLKSVLVMRKRWAFVGYTLLLWLSYWLMTWLLVFSTGPTSHLTVVDGFFLLVVGSFGMAAPVQGGFGAFHIITAMALGIYGISWDEGLIFAVISHESQTLLVVLLGIAFLFYFFSYFSRKQTPEEIS